MASPRVADFENELIDVFRSSATKHEANERAKPLMEQASRDPSFLRAILEDFVRTPGALDKKNYPVVGIKVALNPWFSLFANCWIPLPTRETHISTKAIHHHGDLLLSTATLFGPGYEHWMFSLPKERPDGRFQMKLLESAPHPLHHVSFVDAWTAHTPLYPESLSITLALWTSRFPTTWKDHVKRLPVFRGRENQLRNLALKLKLKKNLDLKVVDSFDFYPAADGFEVMKERKEFDLGPTADHCASVFHILQKTGNEQLADAVRSSIADGRILEARPVVEDLLEQLKRGTTIEGRLSKGHYDLPYANFTRDDIRRALSAASAA
jgi:hypothetical protein